MGCGCGNTNCQGCGCTSASGIVLSPVSQGFRCGTCNVNPCCCRGEPSTVTPYYDCSPQCTENHCQQINNTYFATAICTQYAFNIPACGQNANLYFPNTKVILVGGYLWNPTYGYFEITSFNSQTGQTTIVNHCTDGNASIGTTVSACTCFAITDPPVTNDDPTQFPFVASDFVAPDVDGCIIINVTSVSGLVAGAPLTLGTGTYVLDAIINPTQIRICNTTGHGLVPGTNVIAKDGSGNYQYPLSSVTVNPCTQDVVSLGVVVGCSDGILHPLDAGDVGNTLITVNDSDNTSQFVTLPLAFSTTTTANQTYNLTTLNTFDTTIVTINITNSHPNKVMGILVTASVVGDASASGTGVNISYGLETQQDGGGYSDLRRVNFPISSGSDLGTAAAGSKTYSLAAGASTSINVRGFFTHLGSTNNLIGELVSIQVSYLAIAV